MPATQAPSRVEPGGPILTAVTDVVLAIGERDFEERLLRALRPLVGIHHCSIFLISGGRDVACLGAASIDGTSASRRAAERYTATYWQDDPGLRRLNGVSFARHAGMRRISSRDIQNPSYRRECYDAFDIVERAGFYRDIEGCRLVLSLHRTGASPFGPEELRSLTAMADPITAAVARHHRVGIDGARAEVADPAQVSGWLAALVPALSQREREVCALTVLGHDTETIAEGTGLRSSSIATYRKRAYSKAGVNSAAELAALCLGLLATRS